MEQTTSDNRRADLYQGAHAQRVKTQHALHMLVSRLRQSGPLRHIERVPRARQVHTETASAVPPEHRSTILLVSMGSRDVAPLADALAQEGYWIFLASGLGGALDSLPREFPNLVISIGQTAPDDLRALRQGTTVPILALLPQPTEAEVSAVLEAGVDDCQPMAIGFGETLSRVHALLRRGVI